MERGNLIILIFKRTSSKCHANVKEWTSQVTQKKDYLKVEFYSLVKPRKYKLSLII